MFAQDEERDDDREEEDADLDEENSDDQEEEEDDAEDNADEDSNDDDSDEDSEEDDEKPVTRKELREMLRKNGKDRNASRRVHSKDRKDRKGPDGDRRNNSQSPKTEDRISQIEKNQRKTELLEKKRTFGYENSLSPAQVDVVFRMTKRPTKKFLAEPYVKAALDAISAQSNVRDNTPGSSGRGFKSQGGKSWEKMTPQEKQENFADRRRAIIASKK